MAQEFWPLARRDEGAEPKHSATETRRRREPGCTGDNQRSQEAKRTSEVAPFICFQRLKPARHLPQSLPRNPQRHRFGEHLRLRLPHPNRRPPGSKAHRHVPRPLPILPNPRSGCHFRRPAKDQPIGLNCYGLFIHRHVHRLGPREGGGQKKSGGDSAKHGVQTSKTCSVLGEECR